MPADPGTDPLTVRLRALADAVEREIGPRHAPVARSASHERAARHTGVVTGAFLAVATVLAATFGLVGPVRTLGEREPAGAAATQGATAPAVAGPPSAGPAGGPTGSPRSARPDPTVSPVPSGAMPSGPAGPSGSPASGPPGSPLPAQPTAGTGSPGTIAVRLFFTRDAADASGCRGLVAVWRRVGASAPAYDAVKALLHGPTAAERRRGLRSVFGGDAGSLRRYDFGGGDVRMDFGSLSGLDGPSNVRCRSAEVQRPLEATLEQFSWVRSVRCSLAGSESAFAAYLAGRPST